MTAPESLSWRAFLESVPPGAEHDVSGLKREQRSYTRTGRTESLWIFETPELNLHCDECDGPRTFECLSDESDTNVYLVYVCRNCKDFIKTFAVRITFGEEDRGRVLKYGEQPAFGPRFSRKVLHVLGEEKELLLRGRRSENQGLGIGAFAYYRRVVENAKGRIIDEVLKVARAGVADPKVIEDLESAKAERSFTEAVERIRHGIPDRLLIDGHNPLTLLHAALSEGIHSHPDSRCLELATDIRTVLTRLIEDVHLALREDKELGSAIGRLTRRNENRSGDD